MKKTFFLAACLCLFLFSSAQNSEEEKIKKVVLAETKSFYDGDLTAWRATWAHDQKVMLTLIANNYHFF